LLLVGNASRASRSQEFIDRLGDALENVAAKNAALVLLVRVVVGVATLFNRTLEKVHHVHTHEEEKHGKADNGAANQRTNDKGHLEEDGDGEGEHDDEEDDPRGEHGVRRDLTCHDDIVERLERN
jgi:hypothetical protein